MGIWYAAIAAVMTPSEGANLLLTAARLVFDVSEARKNRQERANTARSDERIRELERKVDKLSRKKRR